MKVVIFSLALSAFGHSAAAQDNPAADFLDCFNMKESDVDRLTCYDGLSRKMQILSSSTRGRIQNTSAGCKIEAWSFINTSAGLKITGATTCASGKLNYRLYTESGEKFISSGFTYIDGFAFQTFPDGPPQDRMIIRYTID